MTASNEKGRREICFRANPATKIKLCGTLITQDEHCMLLLSRSPASILLAWSLVCCGVSGTEDVQDVTFDTQYESGPPTGANFYYNDRAIGRDREAFAAIIKRIKELPKGASIVWGPNYGRCGACSGAEPDCVPKFLYPDLWKELEAVVAERRLTLSSHYPGPWHRRIKSGDVDQMPAALSLDDPALKGRFDAVFDWEVRGHANGESEERNRFASDQTGRHRYSSSGRVLQGYDRDLFFGRLAENSHVLVRVTCATTVDLRKGETRSILAREIQDVWQAEISRELRLGKLRATLVAPSELADALRDVVNKTPTSIEWHNFHGPNTPHEEVLYTVNNRYAGRGDKAIDDILAKLNQLPIGSVVSLPRYENSGRWAHETFSKQELGVRNAKLRDLVPFTARKHEFDQRISARQLQTDFVQVSPALRSLRTVMDWNSGDQYGEAFVSFGRIRRHDEKLRPAAARLGWTGYEVGRRDEHGQRQKRPVESEAIYTLNGVEVGTGVAAFAKAMTKIGALPEGSLVQVRVCLRTKGPFICPIIYEGHHHFERTGYEPYVGLYPWLTDVVQRKKLQLEWVPDEQKSLEDCELAK
jgi:hypothetical protein